MRRAKTSLIIFVMLVSVRMYADQHTSVLDKLFQSSTHHLFNLGKDNILLWLAYQGNGLSYRTSYPFSSIGLSGFYKLASTVTGSITINVSNVTLDLNGNTVTGGITIQSGLSNITIKNGNVDVGTPTIDAIIVNSGCTNILIDQVLVKNAIRGINLIAARECSVTNCEMTLNTTGIEINTSRNIIVKNCTASRNTLTGFGLLLSTTCSITSCRSLATGFGNSQVINATICGFLSSNGSANLFDGCIANGTQALTTTDFNSVVAGFALTGTEQNSYISNSQASNSSTLSTGVTIPYGILLQGTLGTITSLTAVSTGTTNDSVQTIAWSSDGAYLSVGGTLGGTDLKIYQFNPLTNALLLTATFDLGSTATVFSAQWSPDNRYLSVGGDLTGNDLIIFQFVTDSQALVPIISVNPGSTSDVVYATAWSPNGNYLAVGGQLTTDDLRLYFMDRVALTLTQTASVNFGSSNDVVHSVAWSPDGRFLAAGGMTTGNALQLYFYNQGSNQLTQVASVTFASNTVLSVAWSPDGTYLAVGGTLTGNQLNMYQFSLVGTNYTLTPVTSTIATTSVYSISWSPDGRFLAVGGLFTGNDLNIYFFDRGASTLNLLQSFSPGGTGNDVVQAVAWSPDGGYIAAGGTINGLVTFDLVLLSALQFPSNNVISNNIISNNSGALFPSGIGLSGSSIANYIVGNMSFNNPNAPFIAYTNYAGVCNVFNQLFFQAPTLLQNLQGSATNLIPTPDNFNLRMGRTLSLVNDIQTKINFLIVHSI